MNRLQAFPPVAAPHAHTLILGSMPGEASLAAAEYYAHPRNLFWPVMCELLDIPHETTPYATRIERLADAGYALWDVLGACRRRGSLDAAIETDSVEVNDFTAFFETHPEVDRVFFNGSFAERMFRRHVVLPTAQQARIRFTRLPSTSPANASIPPAIRRAAWQAVRR